MSLIVGIDLGTTFSAVAYMSDDGAKLIQNKFGDVLTPSIVGVEPSGKIIVGKPAKELQVTQPDRCVSTFKRYMGTDWSTKIDGQVFTPEKLSSLVLSSLKQDAEDFLGERIDRAVITVPAYFNQPQRKATIRAGEIAGLKVERVLNEPTAAAIAYGLHASTEEKTIIVLDLGGGTFDVSVVEFFDQVVEVRASSGETFLGGVDFTNTLAARVLDQSGYVFEQAETRFPKLVARLQQECEQAKRRLSRQTETEIRIPNEQGEMNDDSPVVNVTRDQFQNWTTRILDRIEAPIRRALGDAKVQRHQIDELILVGGATRMPIFSQRAAELFEQQPTCRLNPDEVVALGAAVQAGLFSREASLEDVVVTDVAPFTLGIEISRSVGNDFQGGYFYPVINRNTTIPTSRVNRVHTLHPNQTHLTVRIFQGEARRVAENLCLGEFEITGIPRGPAGQEIDVRFTYDLNGVLEVEATVVATGHSVSHVVTRHVHGMSADEVARAIKDMAALKFHPRDDIVNQYVIRRAERMFQELPMAERRFLDQLLSGFEEALELQDAAAIESNREALNNFLEQFDTDSGNEETYGDG